LRPGRCGVIAFGRSLLPAAALEDGRIQIQAEAPGRRGERWQQPAPEWTPKRLDGTLGEAGKEVTNGVRAGKTRDPQHGMERLVRAQPVWMGKPAGPDDYREQKRQQRLRRRDGIGAAQLEGHRLLHFVGQPDLAEKLDQAEQAPKRGDRLEGAAELNLAGAENWAETCVPRFVWVLRLLLVSKPLSATVPRARRCLSNFGVQAKKKLTAPMKIKTHRVAASAANPEYLVETEKSGKLAAHRPGGLRKTTE